MPQAVNISSSKTKHYCNDEAGALVIDLGARASNTGTQIEVSCSGAGQTVHMLEFPLRIHWSAEVAKRSTDSCSVGLGEAALGHSIAVSQQWHGQDRFPRMLAHACKPSMRLYFFGMNSVHDFT